MTNEQLAGWLNERTGLTGRDAVTVNVIRQWVAWGVLDKATAYGQAIGRRPTWSRSDTITRRALRLAELRKYSVKRETAVIVQAYIEWGHADFLRVRDAVLHEFLKWREKLIHRKTTHMPVEDYRDLSATKKRAMRNQNGLLDDRFRGSLLEQSDELYAIWSNFAQFGGENTIYIEKFLKNSIELMMPDLAPLVVDLFVKNMARSIRGIIGNPDEIENSGESVVLGASSRKFRIARYCTNKALKHPISVMLTQSNLIPSPQISQISEIQNGIGCQTSVGPWAVFLFVQALLLIDRGIDLQSINNNFGMIHNLKN